MHVLGGILLIAVIFWLATRVTGSAKAGLGAAAVTTVALVLLESGKHHHHDG